MTIVPDRANDSARLHNPREGVLWQKELAHGSTEERFRHYDAGDDADNAANRAAHRESSEAAMKEYNAK